MIRDGDLIYRSTARRSDRPLLLSRLDRGILNPLRELLTAAESETLDRLTAESYARCRQRVMAD